MTPPGSGGRPAATGPTPAADAAGVRVPVAGERAVPADVRSRSVGRRTVPATERRLAEAAVIGVMAIWAGNFIVVKAAIADLPPVGYSFVRFLLAGVVLLALCLATEGSVRLPRRDILPLAALGAVGFGVYQILWTTALEDTTAGNSALIVASTPVFTMLIAAAIGSDTLTPNRAAGALVAFLGVALVIAAGSGLSLDGRLVGDLMTLAAAFLWACYVSFGAPILRRHSPLRTTSWTITFGALVLAPLGIWQLAQGANVEWGPPALLAVLYSALLAAALGNVVVFRGIKLVGPTRITNYQFLIPALAVVLAALVLGEGIHPVQVAGGFVIVLGIVVARGQRGMGRLVRPGAWRRA